jgi:hypothetical protein
MLAALLAVGCGDGAEAGDGAGATGGSSAANGTGGGPGGAGPGPSGAGAGGAGSGGAPAGAVELVSAQWTLEPGTEIYQCTRVTVEQDYYVTEFHPGIPLGTHHTVLTVQPAGQPDGTAICGDPFEGGPKQLYGTGVGSVPMKLPSGVAVKIAKGQQLHLNLHLFNAGASPLSGTSSISVVTAPPDQIEHEAELHIWGKGDGLTVAPNTTSTQTAACTVQSASTLFIVQPHMHQLGKHLRFGHAPAGQEFNVLFDQPYSFDAQVHAELSPPVALAAGDQLGIECTYDNPTAQTVTFGESSKEEMCFAGLWAYPAGVPLCN